MKKLLFTSLILLQLAFVGFSQTIPPPYINYQAVLYDVNSANPNTPLTNQSFTTFVNINDELGNLLYREEHYASTDANGLITVKIGDGAYVAGSFSNLNDINWGVGKYYLVVDFIINGVTSSTAPEQLVTVPYSFYAGNAGNGISAIADNGNGTLTFTYLNGTNYITPMLNGILGTTGPAGTNGLNALIKTTTEPVGVNCANGGTKIETGLDVNGSGVLDVGEVNASQTQYVCNGISNSSTPFLQNNNFGNFSSVSGIQVPSFLKYFGDCSNGNKICVNNELLVNNSKFCNLTIPVGIMARVNQAVRTVIYVKDTLFLLGTINGSGQSTSVNATNLTSNHIGAAASHYNLASCSSGTDFVIGSGNSTFTLSWTANQVPSSYYQQFDGSITKQPGIGVCQMGCDSYNGSATNGQDLTSQDLLQLIHFGSNISGGNGIATASGSGSCQVIAMGGQGGAGLYIIAENIVYSGSIILNGGNGMYVQSPCQPAYNSASAGGGAGSCIISTNNIITQSGVFQATGGNAGLTGCGRRGGNGSMLIVY